MGFYYGFNVNFSNNQWRWISLHIVKQWEKMVNYFIFIEIFIVTQNKMYLHKKFCVHMKKNVYSVVVM